METDDRHHGGDQQLIIAMMMMMMMKACITRQISKCFCARSFFLLGVFYGVLAIFVFWYETASFEQPWPYMLG